MENSVYTYCPQGRGAIRSIHSRTGNFHFFPCRMGEILHLKENIQKLHLNLWEKKNPKSTQFNQIRFLFFSFLILCHC